MGILDSCPRGHPQHTVTRIFFYLKYGNLVDPNRLIDMSYSMAHLY